MAGPHTRPPIVVKHEHGLTFAANVRGHRVVTDQSVLAGGDDSAPSPTELISVALGSCIALYVHQFCVSRGLPHEGLDIEVRPQYSASPKRIAELEVTVHLPHDFPPHTLEMLERVVRSCPVHNTLARGAAVSVAIKAPALTVSAAT